MGRFIGLILLFVVGVYCRSLPPNFDDGLVEDLNKNFVLSMKLLENIIEEKKNHEVDPSALQPVTIIEDDISIRIKYKQLKVRIGQFDIFSNVSLINPHELQFLIDVVQKDVRIAGSARIKGIAQGEFVDELRKFEFLYDKMYGRLSTSLYLKNDDINIGDVDVFTTNTTSKATVDGGDIKGVPRDMIIHGISKSLGAKRSDELEELKTKLEYLFEKLISKVYEQRQRRLAQENGY